jgi:hypothetical protein
MNALVAAEAKVNRALAIGRRRDVSAQSHERGGE